jgi:hypothetical protein
VAALRKHGAGKVFREVASGAKTDRAQFRRLLDQLEAGDMLTVTRLDRLARSTRDLLNTLAAIADRKAGFPSLGDAWAETTRPHGRLMLTVLGGLAGRRRGHSARLALQPMTPRCPQLLSALGERPGITQQRRIVVVRVSVNLTFLWIYHAA